MSMIYKAGEQSPADPYDFIMSTADVDRVGDIVEQDWDLRQFKKNPIALWAHDHHMPIGTWDKVRVESGKLMGRLKLAARGTSEFIDTLHSLVEQRVLKAVSVGFLPKKAEALDEDDPWSGYRLSGNELMECSLCAVPANPHALSLAKSLDRAERIALFSTVPDISTKKAVEQLGTISTMSGDSTGALRRAKLALQYANRLTGQQ